ncbi:hypothetical protein HJG60_011647 [Phyllostomus discolor]|uniref:Uncharacterized protein n=1 Tax=Phyllostomus discolor TaxID=89673 RepID=A0A833ZZE6_9CHIR|nr:hypothetical protein HJG60_011647 [Phyllostomus discolor]
MSLGTSTARVQEKMERQRESETERERERTKGQNSERHRVLGMRRKRHLPRPEQKGPSASPDFCARSHGQAGEDPTTFHASSPGKLGGCSSSNGATREGGSMGPRDPRSPRTLGKGDPVLTAVPGAPDKQPGAEWPWWGIREKVTPSGHVCGKPQVLRSPSFCRRM